MHYHSSRKIPANRNSDALLARLGNITINLGGEIHTNARNARRGSNHIPKKILGRSRSPRNIKILVLTNFSRRLLDPLGASHATLVNTQKRAHFFAIVAKRILIRKLDGELVGIVPRGNKLKIGLPTFLP